MIEKSDSQWLSLATAPILGQPPLLVPAQAYVAQFLETFKEFPPRQRPASFSFDQVMEKLQTSGGSK